MIRRLAFGFLLFALAGCTRAQNENSKLSIVLPSSLAKPSSSSKMGAAKVGAMAVTVLEHVVINITGAGIPGEALLTWDRCKDCAITTAPPSAFTLEVPSGNSRLVQLLAVYSDGSAGSAMSFYYGDAVVPEMKPGDVNVALTIASILTSNPIQGQIRGRYLSSASSGPTGTLQIRYKPDGKPSMLLQNSVIANGWFQVFGLTGLPFEYVVNGETLWGGAKKLEDLNPAAGEVSHITLNVPSHWNQHNGSQWFQESANIYQFGFFGPGVSNHKACWSTSNGEVPSATGLYLASGGGALLIYNPTGAATDITITAAAGHDNNCASGSYTGGTHYQNWVKADPFAPDIEGFRDFRAPFRPDPTTGNFIIMNAANQLQLQVLPGADAALSSYQIVAFDTNLQNQYSTDHDSLDCGSLIAAAAGSPNSIQLGASVPKASPVVFAPPTLVLPAAQAQYALCPVLTAGGYGAGINLYGNGSSNNHYIRLELSSAYSNSSDGSYVVKQNVCYTGLFHAFQGQGSSYVIPSGDGALTINGFANQAGVSFFASGSDCAAGTPTLPTNASFTIAENNDSIATYVKFTSLNATGLQFTNGSSTGSAKPFIFSPAFNKVYVQKPVLRLSSTEPLHVGDCYVMTLANVRPDLGSEMIGINVPGTTLGLSGPAQFVNDCTNQTAAANPLPFAWASADYSKNLYIKATGVGTVNLTLNDPSSVFAPLNASSGTNTLSLNSLGGGNQAVSYAISFDGPLIVNTCVNGRLRLVNDQGATVSLPSGAPAMMIDLKMAGVSGTFWGMSGCTSSETTTLSVSGGQSGTNFSFRANQVGSGTLFAGNALIQNGTGQTINTATPSDSSKVYFSMAVPDGLRNKTVGSHEFPITIPFSTNATSIECTDQYTNTACPTLLTAASFKYPVSSPFLHNYQIKACKQYDCITRILTSSELLGSFGSVVTCDALVSIDGQPSNGAATTAITTTAQLASLAGSAAKICFVPGYSLILSAPVSLPVGAALLGSSLGPATFTNSAAASTQSIFNLGSLPSGNVTLSLLKLNQTAYATTPAAALVVNETSSGAGNVSLSALTFSLAPQNVALKVLASHNGTGTIDLSNVKIDWSGTGSTAAGIGAIQVQSASAPVNMKNLTIVGNETARRGILIDTASGSAVLVADRYSYTGQGRGLEIAKTVAGGFRLANSMIDITAGGNAISVKPPTSLTVEDSFLRSADAPVISFAAPTANSSYQTYLRRNHLIAANTSVLELNLEATGWNNQTFALRGNQFIKSNSSASPIITMAGSGTTLFVLNADSDPLPNGSNVACSYGGSAWGTGAAGFITTLAGVSGDLDASQVLVGAAVNAVGTLTAPLCPQAPYMPTAQLAFDQGNYSFGSVSYPSSSSPQTLTVTNAGAGTAVSLWGSITGSSFFFVGGSFPGTGATCSGTLAAGATCTIKVVYTPASGFSGAANETLTLNFNDLGGGHLITTQLSATSP